MIKNNIAITYESDSERLKAQDLAQKLHLPLVTKELQDYTFLLVVASKHLELRDLRSNNSKPIFIDFLAGKARYRLQHLSKKNELLAKAVGMKSGYYPYVLDVTAGLGQDAFILAALGCEVIMLERSPIVWALLEDALIRLQQDFLGAKLKLRLYFSQAIDFINNFICMESNRALIRNSQLLVATGFSPGNGCQKEVPDVIYLDPMYPERSKSALGKKEMRILHEVVGEDLDADRLLELALKIATKRVVVKRPKLAPVLGNRKPDLVYSKGKSSRFDVYLIISAKNAEIAGV